MKLFEPSIALETCVILNLNAEDYYYRSRIDSTELAIVIAASISNWIVGKKQMVGMLVNGRDPLAADGRPQSIPPRKGKRHLMRLLETLARVEMTKFGVRAPDPAAAIPARLGHHLDRDHRQCKSRKLLDELYQARRSGQNAVLILAGGALG